MFSLVTACMNREPHVRQNLPHWLRLPRVDEIVIVDWSSREPLAELTAVDPRVRVVRVDGEPRWILSYAYNLGIARATQPAILKCDADCRPQPEVTALEPAPGRFFAGNWRSGTPVGKPSVNGQCVFLKSQFEQVNGYSEIIRTYGRDDEDFYDRLVAAGHARTELAPAWLDFLEHTQAERTSNQKGPLGEHPFLRDTAFLEIRNYFLTHALPWGPRRQRARYETLREEGRAVLLRRHRPDEIPIPAKIEASARLAALRHFVGRASGAPDNVLARLDERACLSLITKGMKAQSHCAA